MEKQPGFVQPTLISVTVAPMPGIAEGASLALPAPYVAFFQRFNRGQYFEAHEVLEGLWLQDRRGASGNYFKGLIQIAGAFVHFKKGRPQPGRSLLKLARANLEKYPADYLGWSVAEGLVFIDEWLRGLAAEASISLRPPRIPPAPRRIVP